jgi:hypothetical protein
MEKIIFLLEKEIIKLDKAYDVAEKVHTKSCSFANNWIGDNNLLRPMYAISEKKERVRKAINLLKKP